MSSHTRCYTANRITHHLTITINVFDGLSKIVAKSSSYTQDIHWVATIKINFWKHHHVPNQKTESQFLDSWRGGSFQLVISLLFYNRKISSLMLMKKRTQILNWLITGEFSGLRKYGEFKVNICSTSSLMISVLKIVCFTSTDTGWQKKRGEQRDRTTTLHELASQSGIHRHPHAKKE